MAVDFSTFDKFIETTNGTTIGAGECWDYINLLWSHAGRRYYTYPPSDPSSTNHGVKWGWLNSEARQANTISDFVQIHSPVEIQRGDIIVITDGEFGHVGYANSSYDSTGYLQQYSQNYAGRRSVALDNINMTTFVGGWRYKPWNETPPTPPTPTSEKRKSKFPWVLYSRKIRSRF